MRHVHDHSEGRGRMPQQVRYRAALRQFFGDAASASRSVQGMLGVQVDLILRAVQANWTVSSALRPSRSSVNSVCIF